MAEHTGHSGYEGLGDPAEEAEGELAMARIALDEGSLDHAAFHIAGALACDPLLPEAHELLAATAVRAGNHGLDLYPPDEGGGRYTGSAAALAHLSAAAGRPDDAVDLLTAVVAAEPHRPWAHVPWFVDPELARLLDPGRLSSAFTRLALQLPEQVPDADRPNLRPVCDLAREAIRRHPDTTALLSAGSTLLRRAGDAAEGVDWARRAHDLEPSHDAAVLLGFALRQAGRVDEAEKIWTSALAARPGDLDLHVDLAHLLADQGRATDGLAWLGRVLAADPLHPRAAPTVHALRHHLDGDPAHLTALVDHVREHPLHAYADVLLAHRCACLPPTWVRGAPVPGEAVVGVVRQAVDSGVPREAALHCELSAPEPPSAVAAARSVFPRLTVAVAGAVVPDPRAPLRPVRVQVWTVSQPAAGEPSAHAVALHAQVAADGWPHPAAAFARAAPLGSLPLEDLLGLLAHPPAPGEGLRRGDVPARVRTGQVWTCLGVAQYRAEEPWGQSARRSVLADLVDGPEDWVTDAAMFAMVATAWADPSARADVAAVAEGRLRAAVRAQRTRAVPVAASLAALAALLPGVSPAVRYWSSAGAHAYVTPEGGTP